MRVRLVQGCVDALVCEVWDVFGFEVGKSGGARKQENEKTAERISHYDKVETQINIENLYLTLDRTHERLKEDDYFYVNPQLNRINNIMKSFFKSTNGTSPTIFKLCKTDL